MNDTVKREFIPSLREGVDVVRMIFFKELKTYLGDKYSHEEESYAGLLAAAMMNELFGTPNTQERFARFHEANREVVEEELGNVASRFEPLKILLTDALRMHFLCNEQEQINDSSMAILEKAKAYGILIEERDVPLPKGFMELVYTVGKAHGLIIEQQKKG